MENSHHFVEVVDMAYYMSLSETSHSIPSHCNPHITFLPETCYLRLPYISVYAAMLSRIRKKCYFIQ
jgi:hypothetical protein